MLDSFQGSQITPASRPDAGRQDSKTDVGGNQQGTDLHARPRVTADDPTVQVDGMQLNSLMKRRQVQSTTAMRRTPRSAIDERRRPDVSDGGPAHQLIPKEGGNARADRRSRGIAKNGRATTFTAELRARGVQSGDTVNMSREYNFAMAVPSDKIGSGTSRRCGDCDQRSCRK